MKKIIVLAVLLLTINNCYQINDMNIKPYVHLDVPYYFQLSSQVPGQGPRCCFSYSDAMTVEFLSPGAFGGNPDNYLLRVMEYGDTTEVAAQEQAISSYGLIPDFKFDGTGTVDVLLGLVSGGTPVPIDVLTNGDVSEPYGGGHYVVIIGYNLEEQYFIVNDPYGEMDVKNGGYVSHEPTAGAGVHYSFENLIPRWQNDTYKKGWMMAIYE